jgi:hypothetical protein
MKTIWKITRMTDFHEGTVHGHGTTRTSQLCSFRDIAPRKEAHCHPIPDHAVKK